MASNSLAKCLEKLKSDGASELLQNSFSRLYSSLSESSPGLILEKDIKPVSELADIENLKDCTGIGREALEKTVVLKLNGGLGTSMGLDRAKSLLPVKDGLSFLEVIAKQILSLRAESGCEVPLVLMNSFRTEQDSLDMIAQVEGFDSEESNVRLSFLQNRIPKISADNLGPVSFPENSELEWCPPGHGDLYTALLQTGLLEALRAKGFRYLFVSNADNLGASLDLNLLGYFVESSAGFMMEVADRTESDKKGGHLAYAADSGKLILREVAQCAKEDISNFLDIKKHRYFNTNSLWIDLEAFTKKTEEHKGVFPLPVIRNSKNVDPADKSSEKVIQLETAMGSAIEVFDKAIAVRVPRSRFLPVKKTSDLLVIQSDIFQLDASSNMVQSSSCQRLPLVVLDEEYFKTVDKFQLRFPKGVPSMINCQTLEVQGDITFGEGVICHGHVALTNNKGEPGLIPDGSTLNSDFKAYSKI